MVDKITRMIKNKSGHLQGYGSCFNCGDTWNWKEHQSIKYEESSGMFPLCKECFNKLPEKDIIDWCVTLFIDWGKSKEYINSKLPTIKKEIKKLKIQNKKGVSQKC